MPAEFYSLETLQQVSADGNFAITVPADAQAIVVISNGYNGAVADLISELNFDNSSTQQFSDIAVVNISATNAVLQAHIMNANSADWPGSGSATLYFATETGSYSDGVNLQVGYVKGLNDVDTPVGATDTVNEGTATPDPWVSDLGSVTANDLSVIAAGGYQQQPDLDTNSQTVVADTGTPFNNYGFEVATKINESGMEGPNDSSTGMLAFLLVGAASGAVDPASYFIPKINIYSRVR